MLIWLLFWNNSIYHILSFSLPAPPATLRVSRTLTAPTNGDGSRAREASDFIDALIVAYNALVIDFLRSLALPAFQNLHANRCFRITALLLPLYISCGLILTNFRLFERVNSGFPVGSTISPMQRCSLV